MTAIPIKEKGFYLSKSEFWDAIYLRYGFELKRIPSTCVCGKAFSIEHALTCPRGGFVSMRHNIIRDTTADLLNEVSKDVKTEPKLIHNGAKIFPGRVAEASRRQHFDRQANKLPDYCHNKDHRLFQPHRLLVPKHYEPYDA